MKKITALLCCLLALHSSIHADASQPNIVILYADDLGYGDVQCYNPEKGKIATPNIDRLATEGMLFTDAHSSSAVCTPSRYTLLTGRYHWRTRLQRGIVGLWGSPVISEDRMTLGKMAQDAGYATACIGKWHLGWDWPIAEEHREFFSRPKGGRENPIEASDAHRAAWKATFSQPIGGGPITRGFDEYFGTDVPNWPPYCFIHHDRTVGIPQEYGSPALFEKNQASIQGPALTGWTLEPTLPTLGERAVEFIERKAEGASPFLLYLPFTSPHTPLSVNEEWKGKSGLGAFADLVMETDDIVGKVVQAIDDAGISDNTLVLFTSDNGCAPYIGVEELEKNGHFPSGPFRGYKSDVWEGGHRVPFIVRWPGVVTPGSQSDQLVHQADLFATLADLLDVSLPPEAGVDSFSFLSLLEGKDQPIRSESISCSIQGLPSLRMNQWKWIPGPGSGGWTKGGAKEPQQLYNLAEDPGEQNNLASARPDQIELMRRTMEQIISAGRSTAGPAQPNDVAVIRYPKKK